LLVQWGLLFARTGAFLLADEAVGLMGPSGAHKLGYFAGTLLLAYLGFFRERVLRQKLLVASLAAIVIISSTRAALFYIPLAVTGLFWRDLWRHRRVRAYWVGTVLALSLMLWGYLKLPETGGATLRPTTLYHQQMRGMLGGRYTRIGFLRYTWNLLQGENSVPWGVGPGWYTSKTASRLGAPYHESLPLGVDATLSQVTTILGEYGLVGSLLIALIYASLYRHVSRVSRRSAHPYLRGISAATAGSLIFYAMSTFSNNVFEIQQVAIIPWLFGGGVVAIAGQLKQRELVEAPGLGERHAPVVGVPGGA